MSALQVSWLTSHYEQGKITQDEFSSLLHRIINSENEACASTGINSAVGNQAKMVARLHPETRRTLARVRSFKQLAKVMNYTIILCLISLVYLSAEHYQITGSLPDASIAGLEKLLTETPRKPLPSDIKLAAEYLSQQAEWDESHVNQFAERWQNVLSSERQRYTGEYWFQGLQLALSLHIAEQRMLAKNGNARAIKKTVLLTYLADQLKDDVI